MGGQLAETTGPGSLGERIRRSAGWRARLATSRWRRLPDFIVIGGQRCGTTSLFHSLATHPELVPSFRKEVHYFDLHRNSKGLDWYRANFPLRPARGRLTYEATPNYLAYPGAATAMHEVMPDVKLVALLRNPIDRAHSSWRFVTFQGFESRSFEDAVTAESESDPATYLQTGRPGRNMREAYLEKSRYAEHLERWLAVFGSDQLLIVKSEDLFESPAPTVARILDFVDPSLSTDVPMRHIHAAPPAEIEPGMRRWLADYFAPHNRRLEEMTGLEFDWA